MTFLALTSSTSHFSHNLLALGEALRIGFRVRYRNRQQKLHRHAERARELPMQRDWAFALSSFEIRKITLRYSNADRELRLSHLAPLAQDADWVVSLRQPVDNHLWENHLVTGRDGGACITHNSCRARVFARSELGEPLVFTLRQNGEFLTTGRFNELHLGHGDLSIVDFSAVPDSGNHNRIALDIKDDAPVANPQPRARATLQPLHITPPGLRKRLKLRVDAPPHIGRKPKPLPGSCAGERDLHPDDIANSDRARKRFIANCYEAAP